MRTNTKFVGRRYRFRSAAIWPSLLSIISRLWAGSSKRHADREASVHDEIESRVTNSRYHANRSSDRVFFRHRCNDSTLQFCHPVFLAIRSMSAIGLLCHWSLAPPAATRFPSSIIIAVIVLPHREQFRRGPLMRNTCSKSLCRSWWR